MAIKINWKDLQKRIINWVEVEKVMCNWVQIRPESTPTFAAWIYWNQSLEIISVSDDETNRITIADKDIWAVDNEELWLAYQWGNNRGNAPQTQVVTISWPVDTTWRWPWNYYTSQRFISTGDGKIYSPINRNLRWEVTNTSEARCWPCDDGFHVPSSNDFNVLITKLGNLWTGTSLWWVFWSYLRFPKKRGWIQSNGERTDGNVYYEDLRYWSSSVNNNGNGAYLRLLNSTSWSGMYNGVPWNGYFIRPFKDTPVVPDNTRTVLFQPSS